MKKMRRPETVECNAAGLNEVHYRLDPELFRVEDFGDEKILVMKHVECESYDDNPLDEYFVRWAKDRGLDLERIADVVREDVEGQMLIAILAERLQGR